MIALKTFFTPKVRKSIIHSIVAFLVIKFVLIPFVLNSVSPYRRWNFYTIPILIISFYIHTFLILPILFNKGKLIKYVLYLALICLILVGSFTWIEAIRASETSLLFDGTTTDGLKMTPLYLMTHNFEFINQLLGDKAFIFWGILIASWSLSLVYYAIIKGKEYIKKIVTFKYIELIINVFVVSLILFFLVINIQNRGAFLITVLFLTITLLFFYYNTFFITPILLNEKKTSKYLFYIVCLFILYILSYKYISSITHFEIGPFPNAIALSISFLIDYILSFAYGFIRHKIKNQDVKLEAKESELKLLKSQVNPHFLFNTLNTLYSTALEENAPKTAESTAKLASLIRYMQEDINKDFIPLENEIKYLEDYITIQKLRCSVEPDIKTKFSNIKNHQLSPGLLIPFVENAFKYGIDPSKKSKLLVSVICNENTISFECVNSYDENYKTYYKEQGFGIGIKNAKQRLELVYPKKHAIAIKKENNIFSVKINLTIKNK